MNNPSRRWWWWWVTLPTSQPCASDPHLPPQPQPLHQCSTRHNTQLMGLYFKYTRLLLCCCFLRNSPHRSSSVETTRWWWKSMFHKTSQNVNIYQYVSLFIMHFGVIYNFPTESWTLGDMVSHSRHREDWAFTHCYPISSRRRGGGGGGTDAQSEPYRLTRGRMRVARWRCARRAYTHACGGCAYEHALCAGRGSVAPHPPSWMSIQSRPTGISWQTRQSAQQGDQLPDIHTQEETGNLELSTVAVAAVVCMCCWLSMLLLLLLVLLFLFSHGVPVSI